MRRYATARPLVQGAELTACTSIRARIERKSRVMNESGSNHSSLIPSSYVEHLVRASGTSFYWAMRFLPPEKRQPMFAVYAFCREVDDIADEPGEMEFEASGARRWRKEIEDLYDGIVGGPVTAALLGPSNGLRCGKKIFSRSSTAWKWMPPTASESPTVTNSTSTATASPAPSGDSRCGFLALPSRPGICLPPRSARRCSSRISCEMSRRTRDANRVYLPADLLREHGVRVGSDANAMLRNTAIANICEELAGMAALKFEEASALVAQCDRRQVRPAVIMMEVYRRTFERLNGRGWRRWAEPIAVPSAEKLWIALRYGMI